LPTYASLAEQIRQLEGHLTALVTVQ
jgi:hypothetical protein